MFNPGRTVLNTEIFVTNIQIHLSQEEIEKITGFLGYGNPAARTWFVGIEEGLGDMSDSDTIENLKARGAFHSAMDLYEAHCGLKQKGLYIDLKHGSLPKTPVWRWMARIMLVRDGAKDRLDWNDPVKIKNYIRFKLGRSDGNTFLTELSPIPSKAAGDKNWKQRFQQSVPDLESHLAMRKISLRNLLDQRNDIKIICYGNRQDRRKEFADFCGASLWQTPIEGVFASDNGRYLLLPFFGVGQMGHKTFERLVQSGILL